MLPTALLAASGLALACGGWAASRCLTAAADRRGIALQTVIIMVVLVVIAGAAAAVIVTRAGTETDRLENVDSSITISNYGSETLCKQAGHDWTNGACVKKTSPGDYTKAGPCREAGYTWNGTACSS